MIQFLKGQAVVFILKAISLLPFSAGQNLGALIGLFMWRLPSQTKKTVKRNLAVCFPEMGSGEADQLAKESMCHAGMLMTEMAMAWFWPSERIKEKIVRVQGNACIEDALKAGQGVIVAIPHVGNWEMLNFYLNNAYPGVAMYRPAKLEALDQVIRAGREKDGLQTVPTNVRGVKAMLKVLKQGGVSYIFPDQEPRPEGGVFAPFFAEPALTMSLVSRLVQKTDAQVVMAYAKRLPCHQGFEVVIKKSAEGIDSSRLDLSCAALNKSVESCVTDAPEQYQWAYKRFKRRPHNLPKLYL